MVLIVSVFEHPVFAAFNKLFTVTGGVEAIVHEISGLGKMVAEIT